MVAPASFRVSYAGGVAEVARRCALHASNFMGVGFETAGSQAAAAKMPYALNEDPQPQVEVTFGFWNLNPDPWALST